MSVIFGITDFSGRSITKQDLALLAASTQKYASDGTCISLHDNTGMAFQAYYTHLRSNLDVLPVADGNDNVLSFDGRIDNHGELRSLLGIQMADTPDSQIILQAFDRWGEECFSRFVGDWAIALWAHSQQTLYLARDHAGSRSLYYSQSNGTVLWSTYLETFFANGVSSSLDESFAALYLSCQPTAELTPYKSVKGVPPAHYVRFRPESTVTQSHWSCFTKDSIRYNDDKQYEEQFLELFRQSISRRTGPGAPIVAQLSGGMDSSSIVCMCDHIRQSRDLASTLLDTVSYYDDAEPNWNEVPFFRAVEAMRGKAGIHIDISYGKRTLQPQVNSETLELWPGFDSSYCDTQLQYATAGNGFRVVISGLGGDEVLGGVPTPFPELAELMVKGKFLGMFTSAIEWCLANKAPLYQMMSKTLTFTYQLYCCRNSRSVILPPWLSQTTREEGSLGVLRSRLGCGGPVKLSNGNAWYSILETLPNRVVSSRRRYEYRYPYLDRDLVQFLFSIPRRQLVLPGRRRALMRRALTEIVPSEILERRRKAFLVLGPINLIRREREWLNDLFRGSRCGKLGLIDPARLPSALDSVATEGDPKWMPYLLRLISLELWLGSAPLNFSLPRATGVANEIRVALPSMGARSGNLNHRGEENEIHKTANR